MVRKLIERFRSTPEGCYRIRTGEALLAERVGLVREINTLMGIGQAEFTAVCHTPMTKVAAFVQALPSSEAYHHAEAGGLLTHTLEVIRDALRRRQGRLLGKESADDAPLWSYAVFVSGLLHDVGKVVTDQRIELYDKRHRSLGHWNPLSEDLHGLYYRVEMVADRQHRAHALVGVALLTRFIPAAGLAWLSSNPAVLGAVLCTLAEQEAGVLGELVRGADRSSTRTGLSVEPEQRVTPTLNVAERFANTLRELIDKNALPLNRNGAVGWRKGADLWLVSKRVVESVRDECLTRGDTRLPNQNSRVFDELQQFQVLTPTPEGRAIWAVRVNAADWAHELRVIRLPVARLWSAGGPPEFDGTVSVVEKVPPATAPPQDTAFLDWLTAVHTTPEVKGLIHPLDEGVLLVSPAIFKAFAGEAWEATQQAFLALGLHQSMEGKSVITRRVGHKPLHGVLLPKGKIPWS